MHPPLPKTVQSSCLYSEVSTCRVQRISLTLGKPSPNSVSSARQACGSFLDQLAEVGRPRPHPEVSWVEVLHWIKREGEMRTAFIGLCFLTVDAV